MKIIHTADWHLAARLKQIDRAGDLERAVQGVLDLCVRHDADVLLIAGDLFDGACRNRPEDLCRAIDHLKDAARPFLRRGGTILAMTGNHDNETFWDTFNHAQALVDPTPPVPGARLAPGRFHLATRPTFVRLADRAGHDVQFVLMPFPTASRYLDGELTPYGPGAASKNQLLLQGFRDVLDRLKHHRDFDPGLPSVLAAHLHVAGAKLPGGHRSDEANEVVLPPEDLTADWAYVALGHVHKPQALAGREQVRYSGSIERLRGDEAEDPKQVVLVEVGPDGRAGSPPPPPLDATPFLLVELAGPDLLDRLRQIQAACPEPDRTLVRCRIWYTPGVDDPEQLRDALFRGFPRCYDASLTEVATSTPGTPESDPSAAHEDVRATVLGYLRSQFADEAEAQAVLHAAEALIEEVGA